MRAQLGREMEEILLHYPLDHIIVDAKLKKNIKSYMMAMNIFGRISCQLQLTLLINQALYFLVQIVSLLILNNWKSYYKSN